MLNRKKLTAAFLILFCLILSLGSASVAESALYTATESDQSAVDLGGTETLELTGVTIQKPSGDASSADAATFRGVNAAVRVYDHAELTLRNSTVEAEASNATGVFAYDGGVIHLYDCSVTVNGGGAGGIQVAGGGTLTGENLTVTSASKAAIRSDRGGGTMILDGGTYTSTGKNGCPAIYSTADITVRNAVCVSEQSRAVIIEGKNSVTLENCSLSGCGQTSKEGSIPANVLLYQSTSGDASVGTSVFNMTGGELISQSGAMFWCTNTDSIINLKEVSMTMSDAESLLIVSAGRWGKDGRNGGDCTFNAENQSLSGSITVDSISALRLNLTDSDYTGAINETGVAGEVSVTLSGASVWTLTGDSYISALEGDASKIDLNGWRLFVNGELFTAP